MSETAAIWMIGILLSVVYGLLVWIWRSNAHEVERLRQWRHDVADPAIRLVGYLKERIEKIERDRDDEIHPRR